MIRNPYCRRCGCTHAERCRFEANGEVRECRWIDGGHTLCDAPACVAWYRQFQEPAAQQVASDHCVCGSWKRPKVALCRTCWNAMPWALGASLFSPSRSDFALAFFDALLWLEIHSSRVRATGDLRRLAGESIGAAAREREGIR
jgi:hypothetical protein